MGLMMKRFRRVFREVRENQTYEQKTAPSSSPNRSKFSGEEEMVEISAPFEPIT